MKTQRPGRVKSVRKPRVNSTTAVESVNPGESNGVPKVFNFAEFKKKNTYLSAVDLSGMRIYVKGPTDSMLEKIRSLKTEQAVIDGVATYLAENAFIDSEGTTVAATFEEWSSFNSLELSLIFAKLQKGIVENFSKNLSKATED